MLQFRRLLSGRRHSIKTVSYTHLDVYKRQPRYGADGIFLSVFTSISAFCNAGFDLLGREGAYSSLIHYNGSYVLLVISALIIIGGLGFMVLFDLLHYHKNKRLRLHSQMCIRDRSVFLFPPIPRRHCFPFWNIYKTVNNIRLFFSILIPSPPLLLPVNSVVIFN